MKNQDAYMWLSRTCRLPLTVIWFFINASIPTSDSEYLAQSLSSLPCLITVLQTDGRQLTF